MAYKLSLSCFVLSLICIISVYSDNLKHYDGYTVLRLTPKTRSQLKLLHDLEAKNLELDFWRGPTSLNSTVDVMVPPHLKRSFENILRKKRITQQTLIQDVEKLAVQERDAQIRSLKNQTRDFWDQYNRHSDILQFLTDTAAKYPNIAQIASAGTSHEGRDLRLIKIGVNVASNTKPIIFLDGGIHAREWISPAFNTYLINALLEGYTNGVTDYVNLLTKFDWYILPVFNPDGYEFSFSTRMWRKNRRLNSDASSTCYGTDLNRNFGYAWNTGGSSNNPCSDTYMGPSAYSEPEVKAVTDYITGVKDRVKAYFAVHSYGQLWVYPWGWTDAVTPDDAELNRIGKVALNALTAKYGTRYTIGTSTSVLYIASGAADDWAYGAAGIKYSHTLELRDTGTYGFQLPASQIKPTSAETTDGLIAFAKDLATRV